MELFEELALYSAQKPVLWRDIDDTFYIVKRGTEELLNHLNNIRPSIKLTMEFEQWPAAFPFFLTA